MKQPNWFEAEVVGNDIFTDFTLSLKPAVRHSLDIRSQENIRGFTIAIWVNYALHFD